MEKKYRALRFIGSVYKILGIIVGVLTILTVLSLCATSVFGISLLGQLGQQYGYGGGEALAGGGGILIGLLMSLGAILYGGGLAVTLYALGEGIYLLIALEENTRATALLLQKQQ